MKRLGSLVPHLLLALFSLYILLPPLWVLRTSFVPDSMAYKVALLPDVTLANYIKLFAKDAFALAYQDSLIAAAGSTLLGLPIAAMTGYAFARYRTGGQASRFLVLPVFGLFRIAGLTNSVTGLVIAYGAMNLPFLTWILMGFFEGVPIELEWAAQVDGATVWGAFWRIVIPVSLPGLAAASVLGFILAWNEFLFALILTGPTTATIPVALAGLQSQNGVEIAEISAGVVLAVVPLIIASRLIQRHLVRGLTFGAIK